jgi:hypothetical protein
LGACWTGILDSVYKNFGFSFIKIISMEDRRNKGTSRLRSAQQRNIRDRECTTKAHTEGKCVVRTYLAENKAEKKVGEKEG